MPPLDEYRRKRSPDATAEPFGGGARAAASGGGRFVVQKHAARHTHWDLRLELGGVLLSWAVPRGPSLDPAEKRMAVKVEDHPLEYADFEGTIPKGNYGAGAVIVWDRGGMTWLEEPVSGLDKGKLLFELSGYKLRGVFTLVRTKRKGAADTVEWLLIKKPDAWATTKTVPGEESVLSGLTVEELASGDQRGRAMVEALEKAGAKRVRLSAEGIEPMLAETVELPFSRPGFLFELKYDGYRTLGERLDGKPRLFSRRGRDVTSLYPEITRSLGALPWSLVLDGELCGFDAEGRPDILRLQERAMLQRASDIERASAEAPLTWVVFDLLAFEGLDLRALPLSLRKEMLSRILPRAGALRYSDHVDTRGEDLFREVQRRGLEGTIAKRADAPYRSGRAPTWLKVKSEKTGDFVVVSYTVSKSGRSGFGALELAVWDGERYLYAGKVGSGFDEAQLNALRSGLDAIRTRKPPCEGEIPTDRTRVWVEPKVVCEVRYLEWRDDGVLRMPVFLRLRDDKRPEECFRDRVRPRIDVAPAVVEQRPSVTVSHPEKVLWPKDGYTKSDLVGYYRAISPWMLPYLKDRPIVLTRYPDGITGKTFFQHDAPAFVPGWVRTERLYGENAGKEVDYFVCDEAESLAYVANLAAIPIHLWASRVGSLQLPDWSSIDLDPKGAPFAHVITIAKALRDLAAELGLPAFVKTSGQSGLHVLLALGPGYTHAQAQMLAFLLSKIVVDEMPDIATVQRVIELRGGRVYLDTFQNGQGKTLVAPFCVRPVDGAPVSMPLHWEEVTTGLDPRAFTVKDAVLRMQKLKKDPMAGILTARADVPGALAKLEKRVARRPVRS
jgi:bifunctional non-homologous end joining protein LigD